jgi:C2 domain.
MCVTYIRPFGDSRWVEYHRTEVISNSHDPDFASKVQMSYRFEEQQPLKFEVYDIDSPDPDLDDHDYLGTATCSLGQIISNGKVSECNIFVRLALN